MLGQTFEDIANDIIADAFEQGRTLHKDDVSPEVWMLISVKVKDNSLVLDLTENGEVVAWEFIQTFDNEKCPDCGKVACLCYENSIDK